MSLFTGEHSFGAQVSQVRLVGAATETDQDLTAAESVRTLLIQLTTLDLSGRQTPGVL